MIISSIPVGLTQARVGGQPGVTQFNYDLTYYLPGFPSAPPISPSYSPYWGDTFSAVRGLAVLNHHSGSSVESVVFSPFTNVKSLLRQYVIPLRGTGIYGRKDTIYVPEGRFGIGIPPVSLGTMLITAARTFGSVTNQQLLYTLRVVDSTGGPPARADRDILVVVSANNATVTSSGLFLPLDLYSQFHIVGHAGLLQEPNTIIGVANASSATMYYTYPTGDGAIGGHTMQLRQFVDVGVGSFTAFTPAPTDSTYRGYDLAQLSDLGGTFAGFSLTTQAWEDYYLVLEIGCTKTTSTATSLTLRFSDSSATLVVPGSSTAGSSGGSLRFSYLAPLIL